VKLAAIVSSITFVAFALVMVLGYLIDKTDS
jgi:hypothetical protein